MPDKDKDGRLLGYIEKEINHTWERRFLILDGTLLKVYRREPKNATQEGEFDVSINTKYVTKVAVCKVRPKKTFCFELGTPQETHYFSPENESEMTEWIEALKQATVPKRVGSARMVSSGHRGSNPSEGKKAEVNYQTKVVGGVVVRTPIRSTTDDLEEPVTSKSEKLLGRRPDGLRIIKSGYCIKQGAKVCLIYHTPVDSNVIRCSRSDEELETEIFCIGSSSFLLL
jgi:hypothetical protein